MPFAPGLQLRHPDEADHRTVVAAIGRWWSTPNAAELGLLLPRLFFQHFTGTSWVLTDEDGTIRAFLIGFRSADDPRRAYIHFVGVDPALRRTGTARALYEHFFATMREAGCTEVHAITGPANTTSQAFHRALGFSLHGDTTIDGVRAYADYDGPGQPRVAFSLTL
ncbi:GNAT family N-acetyltransferase [Amycolatopsis acidicola]|uniref:GNAT family N-acetyltransferase n=1 Tax=Amycolatopsis acidicola TaxID=2596893 RepID=A0A5N0UTJ9_9PSEU|nr:GNAT family N-acetyltransferase [Amycolatopsis acidicola]KAA9155265.1 GNAT family N-acetyltransferase [Amycolatopsis acidicola]